MVSAAAQPLALCGRQKKSQEKEGLEVGFGGHKLQPQSTHGILGVVSSPAFPLKLVGLTLAITLVFSGACASSQAVGVS